MGTESAEQTLLTNLSAETEGLSACKRSEGADTDDNSQCTMKGGEIVDEASSNESDADKVAKVSDNCTKNIPVEKESNLGDPASTDTTNSNQPPSAQAAPYVQEGADGSKRTPDTSKNSDQQCYCGKGRNMDIVELQCGSCSKFFHDRCISLSLGKCIPFMTNYTFTCKLCSSAGSETFSKKQPSE